MLFLFPYFILTEPVGELFGCSGPVVFVPVSFAIVLVLDGLLSFVLGVVVVSVVSFVDFSIGLLHIGCGISLSLFLCWSLV